MRVNIELKLKYDFAESQVYRTEGVWPERIGMECFQHFRKNVRPDVFKGIGGLIAE